MIVMGIYRIVFLFLAGVVMIIASGKSSGRQSRNGDTISFRSECASKIIKYTDSSICVCNASYCDYIGRIQKLRSPYVLVYTSSREGLRFYRTVTKFQNETPEEVDVNVTRYRTFQKIMGFGGAFTDSTGINIASLSDDAQAQLIRQYFSKDGIEYNLCRIPIGATDFSVEPYTYDDGNADPNLTRFALSHYDNEFKIPFIKTALNLTRGNLKLFASAWAAPKWMKTNGKYVGGTIKPKMYESWANYYVKFLNAYKENGINLWGITTGNEPSLAKFPLIIFNDLPSVGWTAKELTVWVGEYLGPILKENGYGYDELKVMALDDQRFYIPWFVDSIFKNERARDFIHGTGVHWYFDKIFPPSLLTKLHNRFPEKFILSTEASAGSLFWSKGVKFGSWSRAELYASDIIETLLNWVTGWLDWNMVLDVTGGPTYINNNLDSPIIVNKTADEFYKQPMFYAMGHFSKFIPRDSIVIDVGTVKKIQAVAVRRPDKGVTVVLLNQNNYACNITIYDRSKGTITLNMTSHSISTLLYW